MTEPSSSFLLKVLSGVQFGVEVGLEDGTYSFGSGADADIQIVDISMAPVHGRVRLVGGKLSLRSEGGEIATSSGLAIIQGDDAWHEIAQLDIIMAGTSRFAIGSRAAKWASLSPETVAQRPAERASSAMRQIGRTRGAGLRIAVAAVGAVVAMTAAGLFLSGNSVPMLTASTTETVAAAQTVRNALADLPFAHTVRVTEAVDGTIDAEGYVGAAVERRAILNALNETGVQVRRRVWVREIIEIEVAELLRSQNVEVDASLSPDGVLTLSGTILDPDLAGRVTGLIRSEVFGIGGLDDQIRTATHILNEVQGLLDAARLRDLVIVRLDGLLIEATGVVTTDRIDSWVGFIQVYSRRYAEIIPLRSFVTLESTGGEVGAPIVIGATEPGRGRVIPLESFASDTAPQTQDIFALPETVLNDPTAIPMTGPAILTPPPAPAPLATGEGAADVEVTPDQQSSDADMSMLRDVVASSAQQLVGARPELAEQLITSYEAGETPSTSMIQEALGVIGGRMTLRLGPDGLEPRYVLPGFSGEITYAELVAALDDAPFGDGQAAVADADPVEDTQMSGTDAETGAVQSDAMSALVAMLNGETSAPAFGNSPDQSLSADAPLPDGQVVSLPDQPTGIAPDADTFAPSDAPAPLVASVAETPATRGVDATGSEGPALRDAVAVAQALRDRPAPPADPSPPAELVAQAEAARAAGPLPDMDAPAAGAISVTVLESLPDSEQATEDAAAADGQDASGTQSDTALSAAPVIDVVPLVPEAGLAEDQPVASFGGYEGFAEDAAISAPLRRMLDATRSLLDLPALSTGTWLVLPPAIDGQETILEMAALQAEALETGATLLRLPRGLSALPVAAPRRSTCWPESRIQVTALPTLLLWLDILSLNGDLDLIEIDPMLQALLIEAALSPDRLRLCLEEAEGAFSARLMAGSAFLAESERNSDFGQFLFRSMPIFDLELSGVNLSDDAFLQTVEGRRLRTGMAPTVNSRLSAIGELGALFRVEGGYQVLLYPETLSWRIAGN